MLELRGAARLQQRSGQRVPSAALQALKQSRRELGGSRDEPQELRGPLRDTERRTLRCELHAAWSPLLPQAPCPAALGWGGAQRSAPSAQHPVPSTQRCRAPQSFTSPAGCKDQPAAGSKTPGGAPGRRRARGPGRGDGSSSSMEQTGSSTGWLKGKRGRNEPRKPRGEGFVGTGGRGPARGGRQAPAAALGGRPHEEGGCTEGPCALTTPRSRTHSDTHCGHTQ